MPSVGKFAKGVKYEHSVKDQFQFNVGSVICQNH